MPSPWRKSEVILRPTQPPIQLKKQQKHGRKKVMLTMRIQVSSSRNTSSPAARTTARWCWRCRRCRARFRMPSIPCPAMNSASGMRIKSATTRLRTNHPLQQQSSAKWFANTTEKRQQARSKRPLFPAIPPATSPTFRTTSRTCGRTSATAGCSSRSFRATGIRRGGRRGMQIKKESPSSTASPKRYSDEKKQAKE